MSDLDKKLEEALETIIENGKFVSAKEFIVFITEHFDPEHSENPMRERLTKAQAKIKQAFIDDGWMDIPQELKDTGETLIITTQNQHAAVLRQNGYMTKDEWERQAIKDGWIKQSHKKCEHLIGESGGPGTTRPKRSWCVWCGKSEDGIAAAETVACAYVGAAKKASGIE